MTRSGNGQRWRSHTMPQADAIAAAYRAGVPARALAGEYGVTVRTIYRAIQRAGHPFVTLAVEDWHADFAVTDEGPVQTTPWLASPPARGGGGR